MNLFNKKILNQRIANFSFPKGENAEDISKLITGWQKALKDSDLSKTKEKSIQGKFLNVFFEQILGYEDKTGGLEEWSLIAEPKTEVDSQVADGSLGFFTKDKKETKAVIELKDAKTSLDKKQKGREKGYSPVEQGYLYATKFDRCKWIIVSNFREIRLYNKARSEQFYEKFDVLDLHKEEEFKKFYFLLKKENLISKEGDSPIDDLAKKSTDQEEDISKKFYSDYKEVRTALYNHLSKENKDLDKKTLFEKSQKILDRIVFVLFCEDTANLLPKNILKETYEFGKRSRQRSDEKVWLEMKNLFIDIDEGREDIDPKINGYNGGLFKFDEILDNLHIKDDIWDSVIKLSDYDFETDLNVNILGHIFEQSISDIENLKAQLEETEQDKSKSKRKKDGIFYTPEYITKYIVENTVGKYLEENPEKLESIKILDPACGSGAFLNQAHSYLVNEYKVRHEQKLIEKEKKGEALTLFDYNPAEANRAILLNNLYGVDLNDESVEITKLSLWLKTARKDEPLQNLDNNIKVGNSLIDDPEVAGDKAFDWKKEYKDIMKDGGFDVIIENPPYVFGRENFIQKEKDFYNKNYESAEYQLNTFALFIERSINLVRNGGYLGFVIPNSILKISTLSKIRKYILENSKVNSIVSISGYSFESVNVETVVLVVQKGEKTDTINALHIEKPDDFLKLHFKAIDGTDWINKDGADFDIFIDKKDKQVIEKIKHESINLDSLFDVKAGLKAYEKGKGTPTQSAEDVKKHIYDFDNKVDETTIKYLEGKNVDRYLINGFGYYLKYGDNLAAPRKFDIFSSPRILIREITSETRYSFNATYTEEILLNNLSIINVLSQEEDKKSSLLNLLGVINSRLMSWYFMKTTPKAKRAMFPKLILRDLSNFPIKESITKSDCQLRELVQKQLAIHQSLAEKLDNAKELLQKEYSFSKQSIDLIQIGWNEIVEMIEKNKQALTLDQKEELQTWFKKKQKELQDLQGEIDKLDREIDQEVYKLYGLTQEEINVIEEAA